jgi:hypothetical protein
MVAWDVVVMVASGATALAQRSTHEGPAAKQFAGPIAEISAPRIKDK